MILIGLRIKNKNFNEAVNMAGLLYTSTGSFYSMLWPPRPPLVSLTCHALHRRLWHCCAPYPECLFPLPFLCFPLCFVIFSVSSSRKPLSGSMSRSHLLSHGLKPPWTSSLPHLWESYFIFTYVILPLKSTFFTVLNTLQKQRFCPWVLLTVYPHHLAKCLEL